MDQPNQPKTGAPDAPVDAHQSLNDTLTQIAVAAVDGLGGNLAGLTLLDERGCASTPVWTDDAAPEIDQAQYDADRGPCLTALRERRVVRVDRMDDSAWPEFAACALAHGIHSSLSLPLIIDGKGIGALNLYARPPQRFSAIAEDIGMALAAQAAAAVHIGVAYWEKATLAQQLQAAMESRAVIEQAKGILMATTACGPDDAFNLLRQQSQAQNVKVREIAQEIVQRQQRHR